MTTNIKLMIVFSKMAYAFNESLGKNLEELGMPYSLYPMLAHLNDVGRAKTQKLGEVAIVTSGTITHSVNKLVKMGYVEKIQDEKDKRIFWVQITDEGSKNYKEVHGKHIKYLDDLLEDFSEEDKSSLIELIKTFGKGIEKKREAEGE